jgi:23S rRNA pseudouridine1911/1915/1917 synthase
MLNGLKPKRTNARTSSRKVKHGPNKPLDIKEFRVHESIGLFDFLLKNVKGVSRNNIKSALTHRSVAVDGAPVAQFDFPLADGDIVIMSKHRINDREINTPPIIYEDNEIIVINKPHGLLSIATDKEKATTAYRQLMDYVRQNDPKNRIFVVHRLDKETSGVLMVAKNEGIRNLLQEQWNDIVSLRGYFAIVEGTLEKKADTIKSWLVETPSHLMYSSHKPGSGQEAITQYEVLQEIEGYSLLDVHLLTGRKNQIRVHMKDIGHQVIGDEKYDSEDNPIHRMGLHAYALELTHPVTKVKLSFKAEMPLEFKAMFNPTKFKMPVPPKGRHQDEKSRANRKEITKQERMKLGPRPSRPTKKSTPRTINSTRKPRV